VCIILFYFSKGFGLVLIFSWLTGQTQLSICPGEEGNEYTYTYSLWLLVAAALSEAIGHRPNGHSLDCKLLIRQKKTTKKYITCRNATHIEFNKTIGEIFVLNSLVFWIMSREYSFCFTKMASKCLWHRGRNIGWRTAQQPIPGQIRIGPPHLWHWPIGESITIGKFFPSF
jgi:hypothetical protein